MLKGSTKLLAEYFQNIRKNNKDLQYFCIEGVEKIEDEIINEYEEEIIDELENILKDDKGEIENECTDEEEQNISEKIQINFDVRP